MKSVTFYVGGHKTASSLIRKFLRVQKSKIEDVAGVSCVDRSVIMDTKFFENIVKLSKGKELSGIERAEGRDSFLQLVNNELCDKVVLHNEDFFTAIFFDNNRDILDYIKYCSSGFSTKFVLYIREQSSYIESWYLQQIHVGNIIEFSKFSSFALRKRISWADVLKNMEEIFGFSSVYCIPYETIKYGSELYLQNFLDNFVGPGIKVGNYNLEGQNRSFSGIALKMAIDYFPKLSNEDLKVYRRFLQENFSTRTHEKPKLFSDREKSEIRADYEQENRWLFERYTSESVDDLWYD